MSSHTHAHEAAAISVAAAGPTAALQPFAETAILMQRLTAEFRRTLTGVDDRAKAQRDALAAFSVRVLSAAVLYLSQVVLARWIGSFDYGVYVFVWTWVLVLGGLSHLGMNLVMMRLLPQYRDSGDFAHYRGLVLGGRLFAFAVGTLVALAGLAGLHVFGSSIASYTVLPAYLALVCIPIYAVTEVQDGIGRGQGWMWSALLPPYVLRPVLLLASMAVAIFAGFPANAATAAGSAIVATWVASLVQMALIHGRVKRAVPAGARRVAFGPWLKISLPLVVVSAAELALQNTDILVISRYMTPTDVAIYFASAKTMSLIMFVHYAVGSAVANRFASLNARGDKEGLRSFVKDAVNWTFWPSLLSAAIILALGQPLLSLFGPGFEQGYPVMFILVAGFLFRSSFGPVEFLLNMLGEQALCASVLVMSALLNIALNFALVPHYGLIGAATATSISLMTAAVMNYIVARRRLEIEIAIWNNLPKL